MIQVPQGEVVLQSSPINSVQDLLDFIHYTIPAKEKSDVFIGDKLALSAELVQFAHGNQIWYGLRISEKV